MATRERRVRQLDVCKIVAGGLATRETKERRKRKENVRADSDSLLLQKLRWILVNSEKGLGVERDVSSDRLITD